MAKLEAILFDVGGVLIAENSSWTADLKQSLGLSDMAINDITTDLYPKLMNGTIDEPLFWRQISQRYNVRLVSPSENILGRSFAKELIIRQDILDYAHSLRESGVKVGVLSNTQETHAKVLTEAGIYAGFKPIILSHRIKLAKPNPRIFHYALDVLKLEPAQTLFIDDNLENVVSARGVGMHAIKYSTFDQLKRELDALRTKLKS